MKTSLLTLALTLIMAASAWAAKPGWTTDYDKALVTAGENKKLILLDFTGSDWCPYCIKMDKQVFSTGEFKSYAKDKLVLVELDFPHSKKLPTKLAEQNKKLEQQYGIHGFPTSILVDSTGKEITRWVGFNKDLVAHLKENNAKGS